MNLYGLVSGYVGAVNPPVLAQLSQSTGYTTGPDGAQVPIYAAPVPVLTQVQALQGSDLRQMDALNIQGVKRKVWLNGDWEGLVRSQSKGGDLIVLPPENWTWLFVLIFEHWPDWTSAGVVLQNGS